MSLHYHHIISTDKQLSTKPKRDQTAPISDTYSRRRVHKLVRVKIWCFDPLEGIHIILKAEHVTVQATPGPPLLTESLMRLGEPPERNRTREGSITDAEVKKAKI